MDADKAFKQVQRIPYRIQLTLAEEDRSCSGKAKKLKELLEKMGCTVRYRVCEFRWSDLAIPKNVLAAPHEDKCTHVYLEMLTTGKWIKIDPTWDTALKNILPVSTWNETNDTILAVKPRKILSPEESTRIMKQTTDEEVQEDLKKNGAFYKAFNEWLESNRKHE